MSILSSFHSLIPPLVTLAVILIVLMLIVRPLDGLFSRSPRVRRKPFLTAVETQTLHYLESLFPHVRVHAQVSMSALISPAKGLSRKAALWTHRRYGQKVIDFVFQDRASGEVRLLVELDDRTHNASKDRDRDRIMAAGGYPTVRLSARMRPTRASVVAAVGPALA